KLERREAEGERMMLQGIHAVGMAKFLAGCSVQTYYPITPASDESEYIEAHPQFGVRVVQTEDEIAAIGMAIGASIAGARAATSTSGPGYSLMAEATGWAAMNEQPLVISYYQRGGPSTGLPTRQEQGDLLFTLHASHGEFPRIVLAPGDVKECFYDTIDAFNYADRYQTPVFVLADKHLASTTQTFEYFDMNSVRIDRGMILSDDELQRLEGPIQANGDGLPYKRYKFTESGISTRSVPGQKGGIFWATGDEHDEYGHISEEGDNRVRMMEKRMRKLETADREIPLEKKISVFGPDQADVSLVSWGSTKGTILEALEELGQNDVSVNFLQIRMLSPFPVSFVSQFLSKAGRTIDIEQNYSAQLGSLIRMKTGITVDNYVVKFNGRAISRDEAVEGVNQIIKKGTKRLVLTYGI
ncbi:MAG: 2-oxoacid:acceptor oxidoreductase subunit alpha, partial [Candidatus Geothermarchaeales archaeon]